MLEQNEHCVEWLFFSIGYLPNCSQAIIAMLAAASIGAIWSSTSPDFGVSVSHFILYLLAL